MAKGLIFYDINLTPFALYILHKQVTMVEVYAPINVNPDYPPSWGGVGISISFINIIPDCPPHRVCRGSIGDFSVLTINLCPRVGALVHFQRPEDSKKHTNTL